MKSNYFKTGRIHLLFCFKCVFLCNCWHFSPIKELIYSNNCWLSNSWINISYNVRQKRCERMQETEIICKEIKWTLDKWYMVRSKQIWNFILDVYCVVLVNWHGQSLTMTYLYQLSLQLLFNRRFQIRVSPSSQGIGKNAHSQESKSFKLKWVYLSK